MPRGFSDYDTAKLQGRLWTPAVLRPAAWFDAADLSTITIATGVSEWRDKSGNGRHATQATTGNQPAYSEFAFQGRPGLTFSDHWLDATYSSTGASIWLAAMSTNTTSALVYYPLGFKSGFQDGVFVGGTDGSVNQKAGWWNGTTSLLTANSVSAQQKYILFALTDSTIPARKIKLTPGNETSDSTSQSISMIRIGKRANNEWPYVGVMSEVVVADPFSGNMTRDLVEGYLGWKWGIPLAADHPYANRPPLIGD